MGFRIVGNVPEKYFEEPGVTDVTIPDGVTSIGGWAFHNCINLTKITIPYGVTSISNGVFGGCKNLTSINIPDSVTSIGKDAFSYTTWLENIRKSFGYR